MHSIDFISVLCVDDHPLIRDGIAHTLRDEPGIRLVAQAASGAEAVKVYDEQRPDITLMDLRMPGMNGIEAIAKIREHHPDARFIVLTTYRGDVQAVSALKAGATGYLLKSMLREDLVAGIRAVHAGRRYIPFEIASELAEYLEADKLSDKELDVLKAVGKGCSNKIVADALGVSEDTVKGHMRNIMSKLQANDRTHAVLIAVKRGYFEV